MPPRSFRRFRLVLLCALLLLVAGCGRGGGVFRVTGTVRYKDKPVPNLVVHFVPAEGRASWGATDDNGAFTLAHDRKTQGAVGGTHTVYFAYRPRNAKQEIAFQEGKAPPPPAVQEVLEKYGSLEKSTLRYEVNHDHQVISINLD